MMKQPSFAIHWQQELHDMAHALQCPEDPEKAERIFSAILHTLRDSLQLDDAISILRLLPGTLKKIYIQNWHSPAYLSANPSAQQFIRAVREYAGKIAFYDFPTESVTEQYIRTVVDYVEKELPDKKKSLIHTLLPFSAIFSEPAGQATPFTSIYTSRP